MKAMLLVDKKRLEITDMPMPEIGPEDLLVRIRACGICGSDVHGYDLSTGRRIPPIVMGKSTPWQVNPPPPHPRPAIHEDQISYHFLSLTGLRTQVLMDEILEANYGGREDGFWKRTWPGATE